MNDIHLQDTELLALLEAEAITSAACTEVHTDPTTLGSMYARLKSLHIRDYATRAVRSYMEAEVL